MDSYRTEEEQVEALRRWWDENGRSTMVAVVVALAGGFGWQAWQDHSLEQRGNASDIYQQLLDNSAVIEPSSSQRSEAQTLAESLKTQYPGSTYAQFAAFQLAKLAVEAGDLATAESQLRWVLGKADATSDAAQVAQLRLARVLASSGEVSQALLILEQEPSTTYQASYAIARGDILLGQGRNDEARSAYSDAKLYAAQTSVRVNLSSLEQKLQKLSPIPARQLSVEEGPPTDAQSHEE